MAITTTQDNMDMPEGWEFSLIGNVVLEAQTGFASGQRDESGILQLRMNNITTDGHVLLNSYLKVPIPQDINKYLLKSGDILFNNTNSVELIGKTALFQNECKNCTYSNHITRIKVDEEKIVPKWLLYHLIKLHRSGYFSQICARHVGQAGIRNEQVLKITIPLPPLPEQRRIASILTTVDDAIQRSRQAAAETERLKAGVMHELMTKGIGHTEFRKDPDVGMVPEGWDVKQLGEVCTVKTGPFGAQLHMSDYVEKGTPIITVEHLGDLGIVHENLPLVSDSDKTRLKEYLLKEGDIVFSRVGSVDRSCYISKKESGWLFSGRLLRVRPATNELLPTYLNNYFSFEGFKHRIRSAAVGGTMANLNTTIMNQIKIIFPPLSEQQKIATILSTIDHKLDLQRQRTAHYENLKQGLMNELLTGKRRVKVT